MLGERYCVQSSLLKAQQQLIEPATDADARVIADLSRDVIEQGLGNSRSVNSGRIVGATALHCGTRAGSLVPARATIWPQR